MPNNLFSSDAAFDSLYTLRAQQLSSIHWTPLKIALKAAQFLTEGPGNHILDIGSGVGKFCLIAAHYFPDHNFHGVEQRKTLIDEAIFAQNATDITNTTFIHTNFTELDTALYDHFYFYNSFSENIFHYKPIDNLIEASAQLYDSYLDHLYRMLEEKPPGTRLATYHWQHHQIPTAYKRVQHITGQDLKFWIKS
ncbi:methyltransferase domain-containing protein [Pedobacter sp. AW31-3R]|uniref:methyltransferase domain-containing protein n=1 Tax=Pedobacter sp. AW31-3R TaxID=3445781 RepID=UPI003FA07A7D